MDSDRVHNVTDPVTGTIGYTYGVTGERLTMALAGGGIWTYAYMPYSVVSGVTIPKDDPNSVCRTLASITDDQNRMVTVNQGSPNEGNGSIPNVIGQTRLLVFNQAYDTSSGQVASYCATHYYYDRQSYAPADGNSVNTRGWLRRVRTTFYAKNAQSQWVSRVLSQNDYAYDNAGQRLTNTVSTQPLLGGVPQTNVSDGSPSLTARTETYGYDALSRLKTVDYGDGETQSYGFDPMGNRLSKSDTVSSTTATTGYTFDNANRLTATTGTGAATYTSDADGNTTADGRRTNTWDSQNRLVHCAAVDASDPNTTHYCTYTYGADGLRRSQSVQDESVATPVGGGELNGLGGQTDDDGGAVLFPALNNTTHYAYDGTMLVREMKPVSSALTPTATYLQGPGGPLYRRDDTQSEGTYTDSSNVSHAAGKTRWYVYDGLGSVVGEVDPSGNLTSSGTFDVYGAKRAGGSTGTATTRQGFVGGLGHVTDSETGLIYMQARYYDPGIGRFVSQDPQGHGVNWYPYCDDNPVNEVDKNGKEGGPNWTALAEFFYFSGSAYKIAQSNAFFMGVFMAWAISIGVEVIGFAIAALGATIGGDVAKEIGRIGVGFAAGGAAIAAATALGAAGQVAQFYAGYSLLIAATIAGLDFENSLSP